MNDLERISFVNRFIISIVRKILVSLDAAIDTKNCLNLSLKIFGRQKMPNGAKTNDCHAIRAAWEAVAIAAVDLCIIAKRIPPPAIVKTVGPKAKRRHARAPGDVDRFRIY